MSDLRPLDTELRKERFKQTILPLILRANEDIARQREAVIEGIEAEDNDLICISDNDEIPNFDSVNFNKTKNKVLIFEQLFFYYKFNLFYDLIPWYGTKACKRKSLKSFSWLRNLKNKKYPFWRIDAYFSKLKLTNLEIIKNGGWHFTNIKSAEEIHYKMKSYLHHREFDLKPVNTDEINKMIKNKKAIYDLTADKRADKIGTGRELEKCDLNILPDTIKLNLKKYKDWLD